MGETVKFNVDEEELARIEQRAEETGLSRAAYIRNRFRAGELLWRSGELDGEFLTKISQDGDISTLHQSEPEETETTNSTTNQPASPNQQLEQLILPEIPHKNSGDGISDDELKKIMFGTEEERVKSISKAIEALFGEEITRRADGKLVRIGEKDA